jgi:hypothetical protein
MRRIESIPIPPQGKCGIKTYYTIFSAAGQYTKQVRLSPDLFRKERGYNEMKKKLSLASVIIPDSCERRKQKLLQKD